MEKTTREVLIESAARLFRRQGYHATGLSQILEMAQVPKGSLYHHFPGGKPDLAKAAARWAGGFISVEIDRAYGGAATFDEGTQALCTAVAALFGRMGHWAGCPITGVLLDGPADDAFRATAASIFDDWCAAGARHANRFGMASGEAVDRIDALIIALEGAWIVARARGSAAPILSVPAMLARD